MMLRKVVAVAALAVVGVVGSAGAQPWSLNGVPAGPGGTPAAVAAIKNNLVDTNAVNPVEMYVTYKVELKAEMVGYGPGLDGVDLEDLRMTNAQLYSAPSTQSELMKFGLLQVTTNYPGWDIGLTTRAGGVLTTDGGKGWQYDTTITGSWMNPITTIDSSEVTIAGDTLKADGGAARVIVAIGVVDWPAGAGSTAVGKAHTVVDSNALKKSVLVSGGKPISFVDVFTTAATTATPITHLEGPGTAVSNLNNDFTVGRRYLGENLTGSALNPNIKSLTSAADYGFGPTALTLNNGATFNSTAPVNPGDPALGDPIQLSRDEYELLYIRVGIPENMSIAGNPEGDYSETFTFTMYAAY